MLQNMRFHLGGCMHEYSVDLYDNFVVKPKQKFSAAHSNICISLALCRFSDDFHSITGRNRLEF